MTEAGDGASPKKYTLGDLRDGQFCIKTLCEYEGVGICVIWDNKTNTAVMNPLKKKLELYAICFFSRCKLCIVYR